MDDLEISVIVPVYNGSATLAQCLQSLLANRGNSMEIIVVNDHSTDNSEQIAKDHGVQVIRHNGLRGPAAARNRGAQVARGKILFFVDADITVTPATVKRVLKTFQDHPEITAVFGSYDTAPAAADFLSQYKNLFHHYVHQNSNTQAATFWAGCGAIRKDAFLDIGKFNEHKYKHASIEDIDLGLRLWQKGKRILLEKSVQVKHWKRWTPMSLLRADILYRAIPWSRLILESGKLPTDLNLQKAHRISAALVGALVIFTPVLMFFSFLAAFLFAAAILAALIFLNLDLYQFFARHRGPLFVVPAFFWHLFYYLYSGVAFVACWILYKARIGR